MVHCTLMDREIYQSIQPKPDGKSDTLKRDSCALLPAVGPETMDLKDIRFPQESHAGWRTRTDGKRDRDGSVMDRTTPRPVHTSHVPFKTEPQSISSFTIEKFLNRHLWTGG